ncbi:MAG: hypothetical protein ACI9SK_000249 [Zhongshania sp.]|jgi:hypothetical protein
MKKDSKMANSKAVNIGIPVAANVVLIGASSAATQISIRPIPSIPLTVALGLSATAISA